MNKNTKNLLTAGAVIVGGIILLKGAKEFLDDGIPSGSFGGADTGPVDTKVWSGNGKDETPDKTPDKIPDKTPDTLIPKKDVAQAPMGSAGLQYAPLDSTPTSTFGILGELPISLLANTWSFTGDKVGSGGGVYYPATKTYIDSSGQGYSVSQAPMGAYVNNQGLYDAKSQTFTDIYGQKTSMTKEDASNRQLNIKQTSSTPLQTPDTSQLSETKFGTDVLAGFLNPISYGAFGLANQIVLEYGDYKVTQNTGKNILERNYTDEELEKMSAFEKSIKQEYQKVAEPLKTTGGLVKTTAVKIGASQLSTASKVVSYAQNTASNVVNAVKTSVGSTKSSSGSSGKSSGSSSSSKSSSASSVNIWNSAVKQASSSNTSSSSKSSSSSSVNIWNSAVKQASSSKSSSSKSSSNVINNAISNLAKKSSSSKNTKK